MNHKYFRPLAGETLMRAIEYIEKYRPIFGFTHDEITELNEIYEWVCNNERDPYERTEDTPEERRTIDPYAYNGVSRSDFY